MPRSSFQYWARSGYASRFTPRSGKFARGNTEWTKTSDGARFGCAQTPPPAPIFTQYTEFIRSFDKVPDFSELFSPADREVGGAFCVLGAVDWRRDKPFARAGNVYGQIDNHNHVTRDVERPALPLADGIGRVLPSHAEHAGKLGLSEVEGFAGGFEIGGGHVLSAHG